MELTYTQCKQLAANNGLRHFVEAANSQPEWLKFMGEIDCICELAAIQQGGCASGAYMPAVTYATALDTMDKYGNDVLRYIADNYGDILAPSIGDSWQDLAVMYLSFAVELWCLQFDLDGVDY